MGTNKERIELLAIGLGVVQDGLQRLEVRMADKLLYLETTLNRLSKVLLVNHELHLHHQLKGHDGGHQIISSKTAKLEFPWFAGDDSTEWFSRVNQFFEFQNMFKTQKVALASYHL